MNTVFFEVAETADPVEPFAVIRIDTAKRVGTGVEGVVVATRPTREDADHACESIRLAASIGQTLNNRPSHFRIDAVSASSVKSTAYSFDSKCYDLANVFLEDEPNLFTDDGCKELAQRIQQTIENFIEEARRNYEPPDPPGWEAGFADNH